MEILAALLGFVAILFMTGFRVLKEYDRGVVFRLGRAQKKLKGPGLVLMLPLGIDRMRVVDTRTRVVQIPPQEVITRDNISIVVDAVVYTTVESVAHAILDVEEYMPATLQLAATTLRAVIGRMDLDDILAHRDEINDEVRNILDLRTEQWGVEISAVELKDIELPQEMKRAMARQAEAERERRAKVIAAEGELQAASKLSEAARMMSENPSALQLRLYQTLTEIANEPASKIVVPVPIELMSGIQNKGGVSVEQITKIVQTAIASAGAEPAKAIAAAPSEAPAGTQLPASLTAEPKALGSGQVSSAAPGRILGGLPTQKGSS